MNIKLSPFPAVSLAHPEPLVAIEPGVAPSVEASSVAVIGSPSTPPAPIHPKAMPVILTTPEEYETWMTAPADEALRLQRPLDDALLFGIGIHGTGWLMRLGQSAWFARLEPQPADLGHGMDARGHWPMPGLGGGTVEDDLATEVEAFVASASMPPAWGAAVAVPPRIGPAESAIVLGLVNALRARRDPLGRQLTVAVTIDDVGPSAEALAARLREQGAFVIRGGSGEAAGDHLHHYPLRATTRPRDGRLICVDFADFLHTWQPGRHATLQTIPSDLEADHGRRGCALNMLFHVDMDDPQLSLFEIDRLASELIERRLGADGDAVFTTSDRLDGRTGTLDLLLIEQAPVPGD